MRGSLEYRRKHALVYRNKYIFLAEAKAYKKVGQRQSYVYLSTDGKTDIERFLFTEEWRDSFVHCSLNTLSAFIMDFIKKESRNIFSLILIIFIIKVFCKKTPQKYLVI